jgi:hypothetical protein
VTYYWAAIKRIESNSRFLTKPPQKHYNHCQRRKKIKKGNPNHLLFFIPTAYTEQAQKDTNQLPTASANKLNEAFNITDANINPAEETTR